MVDVPEGDLIVEMLPAKQGDAILLTWSDGGEAHHLLVDGGPASAYPEVRQRLTEVAAAGPIDLLVMTHIDNDHIEGSIKLVNDAGLGLDIREVWFNGPAQLAPELGREQGEMFAALIAARGIPWNRAFGGGAVRSDHGDSLPVVELPGCLKLTVLGPDGPALVRLKDEWLTAVAEEGLAFDSAEAALEALEKKASLNPAETYLGGEGIPDVYDLARETSANDTSPTNASSIVLLVEYFDLRVLLAGDATPTVLSRGIRRLLDERGLQKLELSAYKLPHHGSARNVTRDVLRPLPSRAYLFSSNGGQHGRPHGTAVARCLEFGNATAELVFNYRSPATLRWENQEALAEFKFRAHYPELDATGVRLVPEPLTAS
jgi:beta-lactamase superfamily II metal-dependent hydrolase